MKFVLLMISVIFLSESYGGVFKPPNPLKVAGGIAGKIDESAKNVAGGVATGVITTVDTARKIDDKVTNTTKSVAASVHKGVFDIERGFVNGVDEVIGTPVDINEVTFYLATSKTVDNPTRIDYYKPKDVADTKGKIYFLIHGWRASRNSSWYHDLSEILIRKDPDTHIVQVNWDKPAGDNYALSAFKTESVGELVGILINRLVTEYNVPADKIILIGHSLGAQISGWASKSFKKVTGKLLPRIIALDPAGPLFIHRPDSRRLNKHDAEVVMVIHSDGFKLGYPFPCGTIDFFPNGGSNQPGCWTVDLGRIATYIEPVTCDHSRAWDFFVEAVNSTGSFLARKCESYSKFLANACEAVEVAMGDLNTKETGKFHLDTNPQKPYSKLFAKIKDEIEKGVEHIKEDFEEVKSKFESIGSENKTAPIEKPFKAEEGDKSVIDKRTSNE